MLHDSSIGVGWNNYALVTNPPWHYGEVLDNWERSRGNSVNPDEARPQPESLYWLILAETGYPGFVTYVLFLGVTLWWCLRAAWHYRRTPLGAFLIGLSVALVLTYCHSTVERVLTQTKNLAMWLLFLGIVARLRSNMAPASSFLPAARHKASPEHFIPAEAVVARSAG
jgi:O-antigen ligase